MKYYVFLSVFLFSSHIGFTQSPGFRYGARVGIGQAKISNVSIPNQTGKLTFNAGLTASYQFNRYVGLNADILFTSKGARANGSQTQTGVFGSTNYNYEEIYKLYYFEVPIMAKVSIGFSNFHPKIFVGPSINFNLWGTQTRNFEDPDFDRDHGFTDKNISGLQLMEFSGVVGAGFDVELADETIMFLDIRYNAALNSFGIINGRSAYNNYFTVGVGYLY